jgi:hypothetical protein
MTPNQLIRDNDARAIRTIRVLLYKHGRPEMVECDDYDPLVKTEEQRWTGMVVGACIAIGVFMIIIFSIGGNS